MTTKTRSKAASRQRTAKEKLAVKAAAKPEAGKLAHVALSLISMSPLNYRRYYDPEALEAFAGEIAQHGIISPLTVRPKNAGTGQQRSQG